MKSAPAIRLQSVSAYYWGTRVLHEVTRDIPARSITTLSGPSGCGKSTLLRCVCRMNDRVPGFSLTGTVEVLGQQVTAEGADAPALRRRVGLVFQQPAVFPDSVFGNVTFGLRHSSKIAREEWSGRAEAALRLTGLWQDVADRLHLPAAALSVGQQQRLALARALVLEPEILLVDEPTSALDPRTARGIEELALSLKQTLALLWVTHHPEQAERIGDAHWALPAPPL